MRHNKVSEKDNQSHKNQVIKLLSLWSLGQMLKAEGYATLLLHYWANISW